MRQVRWQALERGGRFGATLLRGMDDRSPAPRARWLLLPLLLMPILPARAQLLDQLHNPDIPGAGEQPGVTVLSRQRPEYDYKSVRLGSVVVQPEVVSSTGYDDNVLGTSTPVGSATQETQAAVTARTNWSRHSLFTSLSVDDTRFFALPQQSFTTWSASAGGTYDIGRDSVSLSYFHQNLVQTPRDLNTATLDSAIAYRVDTVNATYNAVLNRVTLQPGVQVALYSFDNGTVGGQPYLQDYRDRTVVTPSVTASYELAPQRLIVGEVRNAVANYRMPDPGGFVRDYNDTTVLAGLDFQGSGPWRYRALVGYERRTFTSSAFKTIQAPVAELSVIYTPTGLTTVTATLSRQIADSADESTAGLTETAGQLSVDHELLRNILLRGETKVAVDEYSGGGSQTLYEAGASATWLINRNARLALSYGFTDRQTHAQGSLGGALGSTGLAGTPQNFGGNYTENRYLIRLSLGL